MYIKPCINNVEDICTKLINLIKTVLLGIDGFGYVDPDIT